MTTTQERIKRAIDATAAQISPDSIPALRIAPMRIEPQRLKGRADGSWHLHRLFTPLAAAASVAAVLIAVSVVAALPAAKAPHRHAPTHRSSGPPTGAGTSDAVPRYYVALTQTTKWRFRHPLDITVRATATSKRLATITPPTRGDTFSAVTAAANDRTFVLGENRWYPLSNGGSVRRIPVQFYLLRFNPAGNSVRLSRLPVRLPSQAQVQGIALSPDGARLAVALGGNLIRVFTVSTGAERTWSASGPEVHGVQMRDLAWTADGRYLAFVAMHWQARAWGLDLLDTAKTGQNLLADSRLLLPFGQRTTTAPQCADGALLAPDGKTIACALISYSGTFPPRPHRDGYADFSALAGKLLRHVGTRDNRGLYPDLEWISPHGVNLIAQPQGPNGPPIVISPRSTTTLPWPWVVYPGPDTINLVAW